MIFFLLLISDLPSYQPTHLTHLGTVIRTMAIISRTMLIISSTTLSAQPTPMNSSASAAVFAAARRLWRSAAAVRWPLIGTFLSTGRRPAVHWCCRQLVLAR